MKRNPLQLEKETKYIFNDRDLLWQAMVHSSFSYENQQYALADNEVLEFLGDSVLGLVVADYLYSTYPDLQEGDLSKLKSLATSTTALASFAQKVKLDKFILLGKGEEKSGGRKKQTILAAVFEAFVAAVYLDGGLEMARNFIHKQLKPFFKKINVRKFFINNYKSALQEHLQKRNLPAPLYKTSVIKGTGHDKYFIVEVISKGKALGKAEGKSKKEAEQKAAQKALKSLLGIKIKAFTSDTFLLKKR